MKMQRIAAVIASVCVLTGCGITPIEYDDTMLDGPLVNDTSFIDPTFLLSTHPQLDTFDRGKPVIICAHGYTACTYEWEEFRDYAATDGRAYTSLVLLGGHGRDIEDFDGSTWEEWQAPIMAEYDSLVNRGFTRISLAGSSTGGALLIEYLSRGAFDGKTVLPKEIFMIDPIVVPASKLLHIVSVAGPILGNSPQELIGEKQLRHWYTNRPSSTLAELNELIELLRGKLETGFSIPTGANAKCFKAKIDDSADPVTALLVYKGLKKADGGSIDVEMVESGLHVFTQLAARTEVTHQDSVLQERVFREMIDRVAAR